MRYKNNKEQNDNNSLVELIKSKDNVVYGKFRFQTNILDRGGIYLAELNTAEKNYEVGIEIPPFTLGVEMVENLSGKFYFGGKFYIDKKQSEFVKFQFVGSERDKYVRQQGDFMAVAIKNNRGALYGASNLFQNFEKEKLGKIYSDCDIIAWMLRRAEVHRY